MKLRGIAIPDIAGHPTGGAIDVSLYNSETKTDLDMGSDIGDIFSDERMSWFCDSLTTAQQNNRQLLLELMCGQGFAPYWGEWWHYSYGDKEWAAYYNQPNAIYEKVPADSDLFIKNS